MALPIVYWKQINPLDSPNEMRKNWCNFSPASNASPSPSHRRTWYSGGLTLKTACWVNFSIRGSGEASIYVVFVDLIIVEHRASYGVSGCLLMFWNSRDSFKYFRDNRCEENRTMVVRITAFRNKGNHGVFSRPWKGRKFEGKTKETM